jgi:transketolase
MTVVAPCDAEEMKRLMAATLDWPHPIYIRLGKGGEPVISNREHGFAIGRAITLREPGQGLFISTGVMTQLCLSAAERLAEDGLSCGVLHLHTVKPLDADALEYWLPKVEGVVTVEEHTRIGGLGSAILEFCSDEIPGELSKIARIGIPDRFADRYGSQDSLLKHFGISLDSLCDAMRIQLRATALTQVTQA